MIESHPDSSFFHEKWTVFGQLCSFSIRVTALHSIYHVRRYELVVEACDRGTERCCTNTTITVDILDVNDNKPIIQNIRPEDCISILEVCGTV